MTTRRTFLRQLSAGAVGFGALTAFPFPTYALTPENSLVKARLPRSRPEREGISSEAINSFLNAVAQSGQEFHSFMLLRHGRVVAEAWWSPFAPDLRHTLYSLSKSYTSTAVGLAVADGLLTVEDAVLSFFPEFAPAEVSPNLAAMQVRHLLTMTTGHAQDTMGPLRMGNGPWPASFLALPVEHEPGTHFLYNTGATYMLSAIVQRVTGRTLYDFLAERLFQPLGIVGADWEADPQGISVGGYGLRVRTEDIAKLGQLYLQNGRWNNRQLLPAAWVAAATSKQTDSQTGDNDWSQGYGYQFWRCKPAPGFYRGDGAFGQYCIVIPQLDTVVAITSESMDMQTSMNLVWDHLLPALQPTALPSNKAAYKELQTRLAQLQLPLPQGNSRSPLSATINNKTYPLDANDFGLQSVTFQFTDDHCRLRFQWTDRVQQLTCGLGAWSTEGNAQSPANPLFPVPGRTGIPTKIAAAAAWRDDQTLVVQLKYIENVHGDQLTFAFADDQLTVSFLSSLAAGGKAEEGRKELVGRG